NTEIDQVSEIRRRDNDVLGLDVAMNQSLVVRRIESRSDLADDRQRPGRFKSTQLYQVIQRLPLHQAHVDVHAAVDLSPVMNRDNMWLLKNCGGTRLSEESRPERLVSGKLITQDFQCDGSALGSVVGLIDLPHPTLAEEAGDLVLAERRPDARVHPSHSHLRVFARSIRRTPGYRISVPTKPDFPVLGGDGMVGDARRARKSTSFRVPLV